MNSRAGLCQTFLVSNVEFGNFFSDRSKLYGLVMSIASESVSENIYGNWGQFLESPGNFSDPKSNFQIEI